MTPPLYFTDLGLHPVLFQVGPLAIRWYALAYIGSLVLGWRIMRRLVLLSPPVATQEQTDDFLTWATLGVVLGGRLGYVLFYQPMHYLQNPLGALAVWQGGMSFHGGVLGVVVALVIYCRRERIPLLGFADRLAVVVPIGLGFGRIANFINGELWGRVAPDWLWWRMVFPDGGLEARHPSQLYQASMEGVILLVVLSLFCRSAAVRSRFGTLTGVFLIGYGIARSIGETFRQPDAFLPPYLGGAVTMGQLLCIPMVLAGAWLVARARPVAAAVPGLAE